jgi:hypothetical protein
MNWAVIDNSSMIVVNVILWDADKNKWSPPEGQFAIQSDTAGIGWTYNPGDGTFSSPKGE